MSKEVTGQPPRKRGPIVEDTSVEGGIDQQGRPVIRPKPAAPTTDEAFKPTDPRPAAR